MEVRLTGTCLARNRLHWVGAFVVPPFVLTFHALFTYLFLADMFFWERWFEVDRSVFGGVLVAGCFFVVRIPREWQDRILVGVAYFFAFGPVMVAVDLFARTWVNVLLEAASVPPNCLTR